MLLALAIAVAATDLALPALSPTGGWVVDYAEHQCVAQREFATSKRPVALIIKPSPTSEVVQLNIVENEPGGGAYETAVALTIGTSQPVELRQLTFGNSRHTIRQINLPPDIAVGLASATSIGWQGQGVNAQLKTGAMADLMKTLSDCRSDLRSYWNIDAEKISKLKSPAQPSISLVRLFDPMDFPSQSLARDEDGTTGVVLLINEVGKVRECMLDSTSGTASIDAMTCAVIRERSKFRPAIGEDGKAVRGSYTQRVRWELGGY